MTRTPRRVPMFDGEHLVDDDLAPRDVDAGPPTSEDIAAAVSSIRGWLERAADAAQRAEREQGLDLAYFRRRLGRAADALDDDEHAHRVRTEAGQ